MFNRLVALVTAMERVVHQLEYTVLGQHSELFAFILVRKNVMVLVGDQIVSYYRDVGFLLEGNTHQLLDFQPLLCINACVSKW